MKKLFLPSHCAPFLLKQNSSKLLVSRLAPMLLVLGLQSQMRLMAQGTAFTYQGRLTDSGGLANGIYDFRFRLATDPAGNNLLGGNVLTNGIGVTNGLFTATIDFGAGIFTGSNLWLEVDVRTNGALGYTGLTPLQALTPAPYAVMAGSSSNLLGALPAAQLTGPILSPNLAGTYSGAVIFNNTANQFTGLMSGNGSRLTNVNASFVGGLAAANLWQLGGNNVGNGQFLGSTNNQPLELRVGGLRGLRLEAGTNGSPNVIGGSISNSVEPM